MRKSKSFLINSTPIAVCLCAVEIGGYAIFSHIASKSKGRPSMGRNKQLAAYLSHVALSVSFVHLSQQLQCDRSTIDAACARVEDLRDDKNKDQLISLFETVLTAWTTAFIG